MLRHCQIAWFQSWVAIPTSLRCLPLVSASPFAKPVSGRQSPFSFQFPTNSTIYSWANSFFPGPVQPTCFPEVKSLTVKWDQCHHADCGMGLEIPALFNAGPLGKLQSDGKFKEGSGDRRGLGDGTGTEHSCSFSPSAYGDQNALCLCWQLGGRWQET